MLTSDGDQLILEPADEVGTDTLKTTPAILLCQLGGVVVLFRHGGSRCGDLDGFTWRDGLGNGLGWFGCRFGRLLGFRLLSCRLWGATAQLGLLLLLILAAIMRSLSRFQFGGFGPGCVE